MAWALPRQRIRVRVALADCLIVQHVEPELSSVIGAALVRAGIRNDVRPTFAGDSDAPDASGMTVSW